MAFFFPAWSHAMSDSALRLPASATSPRTLILFCDPVRGVRWYSCICAGLTTIISSILPTDHTLISVYTSICQLIYDLIHESASLLFLAATPRFPPEWRLASLQKSVPPLTGSGNNWVSFENSDRSPPS